MSRLTCSTLLFSLALSTPALAQAPAGTPTTAAADANALGTPSVPTWLENVDLFFGLDGSKQPQDLGINANMGVRFAANAGVPVWKRANLGAQVGMAMNFSDAAVHVLEQIHGTSRRTQTFVTAGLFQQATTRLSWALGYDFQHQTYFDTFRLGQVRGSAGYAVKATDEVGAWFTKSVKNDQGVMGETTVHLDPISQFNVYLKHRWPTMAQTTIWAGMASGHHNVVLLLPDNSRATNVIVYGAKLELPLSNRLSVTGSGNFLTPAATGTVDAYLGVTFYPGRRNLAAGRGRFAPPTMVANNPEFPVDLRR
jgi:hypothetical protein